MMVVRRALFVVLVLPTFVVAAVVGIVFYGLFAGFNAGLDFMQGLSK